MRPIKKELQTHVTATENLNYFQKASFKSLISVEGKNYRALI